MLTFYCPNCWKNISEGSRICPNCAHDLSQYSQREFEEKLISALNHPIQDNRIMAIQILGDLRSTSSLHPFEQILHTETQDFYVLKAVLEAIAKIDDPQGQALLEQAESHPSMLVRHLARILMDQKIAKKV
jgi:HEAT repeat protein